MLNRLKHLFGDKKNKEFGINNITPKEKKKGFMDKMKEAFDD